MKQNLLIAIIISIGISSIGIVSATQYYYDNLNVNGIITINGTGNINGANIKFMENADNVDKKFIRAHNGYLDILNKNYKIIEEMTDSGVIYSNSIVQANAVTNNTITVSTNSSSPISSGFGITMYGKYLNPTFGSGVDVHGVVYAKNSNTNCGFKILLYRSYVGIPSLGSSPYSGDYPLKWTPPTTQYNDNFNPEYLEYTDLGNNTSNQYYYWAFERITCGTVIISSDGSHMTASVT